VTTRFLQSSVIIQQNDAKRDGGTVWNSATRWVTSVTVFEVLASAKIKPNFLSNRSIAPHADVCALIWPGQNHCMQISIHTKLSPDSGRALKGWIGRDMRDSRVSDAVLNPQGCSGKFYALDLFAKLYVIKNPGPATSVDPTRLLISSYSLVPPNFTTIERRPCLSGSYLAPPKYIDDPPCPSTAVSAQDREIRRSLLHSRGPGPVSSESSPDPSLSRHSHVLLFVSNLFPM